jgi:predicted GIY-YIG superfamily endonuclease
MGEITMPKFTYVYEILDDEGRPVYVGSTKNLEKRASEHMASGRNYKPGVTKNTNIKLADWISGQIKKEHKIKFRVYAKFPEHQPNEIEYLRIEELGALGYSLFNNCKHKKCQNELDYVIVDDSELLKKLQFRVNVDVSDIREIQKVQKLGALDVLRLFIDTHFKTFGTIREYSHKESCDGIVNNQLIIDNWEEAK